MKGKNNSVENEDLLSLCVKPHSYPAKIEGSESDVQKREEVFTDRHDQFNEDFWNLVGKFPFKELMDRLERTILISALNKFEGNQRKAAKFLNMKPTTLYEKIKKHNISIIKMPYRA